MKLLAVLLALTAYAHEGHDHNAPTKTKAKVVGAQIKGNEDYYLEVKYAAKVINVYPFDKNQAPIKPESIQISAMVEVPRKKAEAVTLRTEGDHYAIDFDPKSAHRFTLLIKFPGAHGDVLKYTIEPRK